jgi:hypothetical protein
VQSETLKLHSELEEQLHFIILETDDSIKRAELSIEVINISVKKLRSFIVKHKFKSENDEIHFFKKLKPSIYSKLIYHNSVYNIEAKMPTGGDEATKKYLAKELDKLKQFFHQNLEFYKYYRTNSSHLDHKYFVRGKHDIRLELESFIFDSDPKFTTSHDHRISKILANDQLQVYLEDRLASYQRPGQIAASQVLPKTKLNWSESKTALIEIIYALHSQGVFENGKADLKEIASYFETMFNIDLGDYYRTYLEIRMRKSGRTKFLDNLKNNLLKRMDEADDK